MSLQTTLESIQNALVSQVWHRLNEAQTIQVIVLRLLQELDWDVWNPHEVWPQKNSGGGSGSYVPDFILHIDGIPKITLEAKALNARFTDNEIGQAINYATNHRLRWAILTDGRSWHFYDKNLTAQGLAPSECGRLTLDLLDTQVEAYFRRVLSRDVWGSENADDRVNEEAERIQREIRRRQSLEEIKSKLSAALSEGYAATSKGIEKAIYNELEPNERDIAIENLEHLEDVLIGQNGKVASTPFAPVNQDVVLVFKQCISQIKLGRNSGVKAWIKGEPLRIVNWGDLLLGCVETYLKLGRSQDLKILLMDMPGDGIIDRNQEKENITYRNLSDGRLLYVNLDASDSQEMFDGLTRGLGLQRGLIEVEYNNDRFTFPRH